MKKMPNVFELLESAEKMIQESAEKSVNDQFGHDVGDKVIAAFYDMLESSVSKLADASVVARVGGDEFAAIITGNKYRAYQIAEAYRNNITCYDFNAIDCIDKKIGCYVGIVEKNTDEASLKSMLDLSLEAVDNARKKGMNMISVL